MNTFKPFKRNHLLPAASLPVAALLWSAASVALAAPADYQTAVVGDSPYVYYRLQETGTLTDTSAADLGTRPTVTSGIYRGNPTSGIAGAAGPSSDTAVSFPGTTLAGQDYLRTTDARGLGSLVGTSSYEFIFKTNADFPTAQQALFGIFNPSAAGQPTDVEVTLNSQGNDAFGATANTTRFYVRGADGDAVGVHFANPKLYDGNYHHLVFTFDRSTLSVTDDPDGTGPLLPSFTGGFAAYVDGAPQPLTIQVVGRNAADPDVNPDTFVDWQYDPTFAARNVRGNPGRDADVTLDETALYAGVLTWNQVLDHARASAFLIAGDTNASGTVDADDYALIDRGYARYLDGSIPAGGAGWSDGDFDNNGIVDAQDYMVIDTAYAAGHAPSAGFLAARAAQFGDGYVATLAAAVPEPAMFGLVAIGLCGVVVSRRNRKAAAAAA